VIVNITQAAKAAAGVFEVDLGIEFFFADKMCARKMKLPKGYKAYSHAHTYDHLSVLARGIARVTTDADSKTYHAGDCITIKAGVHHQIEALEDIIWFCIHPGEPDDVGIGV
jgi:quercetin dioxygenase-like cupin family protein